MQIRTCLKWRSTRNFLDPYSEWVILGFRACPNNRPNGILLDPHSEQMILGFQACPSSRPNRILLDPWFELVILGPTVSCCLLLIHVLVVPSSSCIYLWITKVQLLGSITFSYILKLILARKEFTFCWRSLAWLHIIGP
jgi:hypothetical protein